MKTFLKIFGGFILLIVMFAIVSIIARGNLYHFEKSIVINAPKEKVWSHINSMKAFNQWNPWLKLDPNIKLTYTGTDGEVGDRYCWDSQLEDAGAGCQHIIELIPGEKQKTEMLFKKPFDGQATSEILISAEGNGTKVTWTMETEQDAMMKVMKPIMDYQMDKSYGEGLENLRKIVQ